MSLNCTNCNNCGLNDETKFTINEKEIFNNKTDPSVPDDLISFKAKIANQNSLGSVNQILLNVEKNGITDESYEKSKDEKEFIVHYGELDNTHNYQFETYESDIKNQNQEILEDILRFKKIEERLIEILKINMICKIQRKFREFMSEMKVKRKHRPKESIQVKKGGSMYEKQLVNLEKRKKMIKL